MSSSLTAESLDTYEALAESDVTNVGVNVGVDRARLRRWGVAPSRSAKIGSWAGIDQMGANDD